MKKSFLVKIIIETLIILPDYNYKDSVTIIFILKEYVISVRGYQRIYLLHTILRFQNDGCSRLTVTKYDSDVIFLITFSKINGQ